MIPNESLGKNAYNVEAFRSTRQVYDLLLEHKCVYYNCRFHRRATEQAETWRHNLARRLGEDVVFVRRVGRRVVAERGPRFDSSYDYNNIIEQMEQDDTSIPVRTFTFSSSTIDQIYEDIDD